MTETIGLALGLAAQTGAIIWWASSLNTRVKRLEAVNLAADRPPTLTERVTRLEAFNESLRADISEIKDDVKSIVREIGKH